MLLDYYVIETELRNIMEYLNGKINTIRCHTVQFSYAASKILAGEHNGAIYFYPPKIWEKYKDSPESEWRTMFIVIVAHELSHINQMIDYDRYMEDIEYQYHIEGVNEIATYQWILNNINTLTQVYPYIDVNLLYSKSKHLNLEVTTHTINDLFEIMHHTLEKYMNGATLDQFANVDLVMHYDNIVAPIIVKRDGTITNMSAILEALHSLYNYTKYSYNTVPNLNTKSIEIHIYVYTNDMKFRQVVFTNVPYYGA